MVKLSNFLRVKFLNKNMTYQGNKDIYGNGFENASVAKVIIMNEVNLKSLAKELGLAVSTVSRALRDCYDISPKTKEKVQALAIKHNYVANPYVSSLRKNQSKTIGVVIPNVVNNFFH
jgi:hypothetical protein